MFISGFLIFNMFVAVLSTEMEQARKDILSEKKKTKAEDAIRNELLRRKSDKIKCALNGTKPMLGKMLSTASENEMQANLTRSQTTPNRGKGSVITDYASSYSPGMMGNSQSMVGADLNTVAMQSSVAAILDATTTQSILQLLRMQQETIDKLQRKQEDMIDALGEIRDRVGHRGQREGQPGTDYLDRNRLPSHSHGGTRSLSIPCPVEFGQQSSSGVPALPMINENPRTPSLTEL